MSGGCAPEDEAEMIDATTKSPTGEVSLQLDSISKSSRFVRKFSLSKSHEHWTWETLGDSMGVNPWLAQIQNVTIACLIPVFLYATGFLVPTDVHAPKTFSNTWGFYYSILIPSVLNAPFPFYFIRGMLRLDAPLKVWPGMVYSAWNVLCLWVMIHFVPVFPLPFRVMLPAVSWCIMIPTLWYFTLSMETRNQPHFQKKYLVAALSIFVVPTYFFVAVAFTFGFVWTNYIGGVWADLIQFSIMATFQVISILFKRSTIRILLLVMEYINSLDPNPDTSNGRVFQVTLISVMMTFCLELCEETFVVFVMPEASSYGAIIFALALTIVSLVREGVLLDRDIKGFLKQHWITHKMISILDAPPDALSEVENGRDIDKHRGYLLLSMLAFADIFADLAALIIIPIIYYGPSRQWYSMSKAPERNIIATMILNISEIAVICAGGLLISKRIESQSGIHPFKEAVGLIYANRSFTFWVVCCALMFPTVTLGEHWNIIWWLKDFLEGIYGPRV